MLLALWFILSATSFSWAQAAPSIASAASDLDVSDPFLEPIPSPAEILVYDFTPSHESIWSIGSKEAPNTPYADWKENHVTVYQPTDCEDGSNATWRIETLNLHGNFFTTNRFTRIPIALPPYIDRFKLDIQCENHEVSQVWRRSNSQSIPTLYWRQSERGVIETILHNGQTLSLHISVQTYHGDEWEEIIVLYSSHPFEVWTLPNLTAKRIRMEVKSGNNILIRQTISPVDLLLAPSTTFPSGQTIQFDLPHSEMSTISSNTTTSQPQYFYHQRLSFTPSTLGLHWLEVHSTFDDRLASFWVYDGAWKWFTSPVWETSNTTIPFTVLSNFEEYNTIPFLRWNDSLLLDHRSSKDSTIHSESYWVHGEPTKNGIVPLQVSPEDRLHYRFDTHSLMNTHIESSIDMNPPLTQYQWLLRSDVQASDERLMTLLPFIYAPMTPLNAARILHHTALFWNPLHTRELDWFNQLQLRANQALRFLEKATYADWRVVDTQTRLFIVWASLTADREGLSPSSSLMQQNLDWLCSIQEVESESKIILDHVRWMVTQSFWKHRSCKETKPLSLDEQLSAKPQMQIIKKRLDFAWDHKRLASLPEQSPEWMTWLLLEKEQQLKKRYVNLHLHLQSESVTERGLFHEWQIRPLTASLNEPEESSAAILSINGVGRVYTSMWTGSSTIFIEEQQGNLKIHREIKTPSGDTVNPLDVRQGQPLAIHTNVQTTSHTPFCLRRWHASGLSNHQVAESHFCTISDADGQWHDVQKTFILFEGRFRLPATMVATETSMAHTNTVWFETKQYKELMPK